MNRCPLYIAVSFLLLSWPPTSPGETVVAQCSLEVRNTKYIEGQCQIETDPTGSLIMRSIPLTYFAVLNMDSPTSSTGDGYWNKETTSTHAHAALGAMTKKGACWLNETAKICWWKKNTPG